MKREKFMRVKGIYENDDRKKFQLDIALTEGNYSMCVRAPIVEIDGQRMVTEEFVLKMMEMAYLGHVLTQGKEF